MAFGYSQRTRGEVLNYSRPNTITEFTPYGSITYKANEPRTATDDWGNFLGMVFGDGGSAEIPSQVNPHWVDDSSPVTLLAIGQAPVGVVWLKCGSIEIGGVGGHKMHKIEIPSGSTMEDSVQLFPNAESIPEDCHVMLVKYYNESNLDFGTEGEAMVEFNEFMIGDWN